MKNYFYMLAIIFLFSPLVNAGSEVEVGNGGSGIALALENARDVLVYVLKEKTVPPFEAEDHEYEAFLDNNKPTLMKTLSAMEFEPKLPQEFNSIGGCAGRDLCIIQKDDQIKIYFRSDALYLAMAGLNNLFARLIHEAAHSVKDANLNWPHAVFDKFGLSVSKHLLISFADDPKITFAQTLYEGLDQESVCQFAYWLEFKKALYAILKEKEALSAKFSTLPSLKYPLEHAETLEELEREARAFALKHIQSQSWFLEGISIININVRQLVSIIFLLPKDSSLRKQSADIIRHTIDDLCQWTLTGSFTVWAEGYDNGFWSSRYFKREWPIENLRVFKNEDFKHLFTHIEGDQK